MEKVNKSLFFSIIIPCLNEEKYLPKLLIDLTSQTFKDFEVIIVDGKSEDKTVVKASEFKSKFKSLKIITSERRNVCFQRNLGAKYAKCEWLIFMDADNLVPPYFLQGIKFWIEAKKPDILSSWFDPDGNNNKDKAIATLSNIYLDIQKTSPNPYLHESMVCINKASFTKLKGFNEKLSVGEGSDLLKRAFKKRMKFSFVREPKYITSFRRLRKLGTLTNLRNMALIEISRLTDKKLSNKKIKHLYPMEGGKYFSLNKENNSRLESIVNKILKGSNKVNEKKTSQITFLTAFKNYILNKK